MKDRKKCCVGGCNATGDTHRLFSFPKNDNLRNLWMTFLVPVNSLLIGLSKEQLLRKHVCEQHFDNEQFDSEGRRLRYSYPCLITNAEIAHGIPLSKAEWNVKLEHNYSKEQDKQDDTESVHLTENIGQNLTWEHNYSKEQNGNNGKQLPLIIGTADVTFEQPSSSGLGSLGIGYVADKQQSKKSAIQKQNGHSVKIFGSKKRKFIKEVTKIATDHLGDSSSQRLAQAQTLANDTELLEKFNLLNKQVKTFLLMQLKQVRKSKMARRFTLEEKLMALLIMKQSPKGYKLLEKIFALPNKRTLVRLSEKVSMEPGLNPKIFDHIAHSCKNWNMQQKLCTIVFDEVALTPHLTFNEKKEMIHGFVDVAGERKMKYCDHALVFMIRGICSPWRQTIAYYFCEGTVSSADLQNILKQIVSQVALTGLIPLGLVCDQGSTFRTAMKRLREDTIQMRKLQGVHDDGSINIAGHDISIFYDPPHLLKGLRNNFLTKDIVWNGKTASWKDIEFIFDIDSKLGHTRALPKLTAHHVVPTKIKKMKVSVAAQVLSARTAALLKYTNEINKFRNESHDTMDTTAEVVEFFDSLFDSVNGSPGAAKKGKLRRAVKKNSPHLSFWIEAIKKIKKINFVDKLSKLALQRGKPRLVRVPSLQGWITTLESFIRLSKVLFNKYCVEYFYPRRINQDPLENFFGRIRALNYRNVNPDANTFIYAYKSLMLSNVLTLHSKFSNCEEDKGETLLDISILFENDSDYKENIVNHPPSYNQENPREKLTVSQVVMEKIKVHCSAYTAGYICRKISKAIKCKSCLKTYTSTTVENIHRYIQFREYKSLKNNNLSYPNQRLLILYRDVAQLIHNYLNINCFKTKIKSILMKIILSTKNCPWLGCSKHNSIVTKLFVIIIIRLHVHNWCNIINKILKGDIEAKYVNKMQEPQKQALQKYKRFRLRKKCKSK